MSYHKHEPLALSCSIRAGRIAASLVHALVLEFFVLMLPLALHLVHPLLAFHDGELVMKVVFVYLCLLCSCGWLGDLEEAGLAVVRAASSKANSESDLAKVCALPPKRRVLGHEPGSRRPGACGVVVFLESFLVGHAAVRRVLNDLASRACLGIDAEDFFFADSKVVACHVNDALGVTQLIVLLHDVNRICRCTRPARAG